jgi:hypothetical protein
MYKLVYYFDPVELILILTELFTCKSVWRRVADFDAQAEDQNLMG